jgi:outer membrane protein
MRIAVAVALLLPLPLLSQDVQHLSLNEAIAIGLQQNTTLAVSREKVESAKARAADAGTPLLPSLKLEGSYRRLSEVDPFQVSLPIFPQPIEISPVVLNNYSVRVGLQQPLFTGWKLSSASRSAEYLSDAIASEAQSDQEDLILQIQAAYWKLYQANEVGRFVDENVSRLEAHEADAKRLIEAGAATRNDLLKIQVQLSGARLSQIDAGNDIRLAMMGLNNILGQQLETEIDLTSRPSRTPDQPVLPDSVQGAGSSSLLSYAVTNRPEVRSLEARVKANQAAVSAAQGNWWPQIYLSGNYYYSRPNARYLPTRDEFLDSWDIGVVLQFDLWNWGSTGYKVDEAEANSRQANMLFNQMKDNVRLDVTRNELLMRRSREKLDVARLGITQAEENFRTTNDKYKTGLATSSDLLDADVALLQAHIALTGAQVELELTRAQLMRALGVSQRGDGNLP